MANPSRWGNVLRLDGDIGHTYESDIAALADGRFVATWTVYTASGEQQVRGQLSNADGSRKGAEFILPIMGQFAEMSVTALTNGGFAIAWVDRANNMEVVRVQIFDHDGNSLSAPIFVDGTTTTDWERVPQIAAGPGGGFAVTWVGQNTTVYDLDARVRIFNADGSPAGNRPALEVTGVDHFYSPDVAMLSDGRTVVVWHEGSSTYARIFSTDGSPASAAIALDNTGGAAYKPAVTALANGGFAAVWTGSSGTGYDVYARVFDASGNFGARIAVNASTVGGQSDPAVALLRDGRLVVAWADDNNNGQSGGSYTNIRAQVLNFDGTRSGDELLVNTDAVGFGSKPSITAFADGRFVVAWHDNGPTANGLGRGEYAQIFDPREGAVTLAGTPLDDDWVGTRFDDTFSGAAGDDRIDGGAGDDTAVYSGRRDQYAVTDLGDRIVVSGPEGTDDLRDVEHLRFAPETAGPTPANDPSGLFDTRFYLAENADVSAAGVSALDHYNAFGWHEGRDPNAFFDSTGYLAANPQVRATGLNPVEHYHATGWREGRDPSGAFDTTLYLLHNPDVAAMNVDPLEHYLQHGRIEGRAVHAAVGRDIVGGFDAEYYAFHNPDVAAAGVDPLEHFNTFGWHEGRNPNGWFDTAGYLAHYADVAASGVNPLDHYIAFGWNEGRDPSVQFDTLGYLAANPDVAASDVNPLEHFLTFGIYEGRQAVTDGLWQ